MSSADSSIHPLLYRFVFWYIYFFVFIASFIQYAMVEPWSYVSMDYPFFYNASRNVLSGESPYPAEVIEQTPGADRAWGKYVYPPLYAWLTVPFAWLPILWSKKALVYVCIFFYFLLLTPWKSANPAGRIEKWATVALLCIWGPAIETLRFGQSNFATLFLVFFALVMLEKLEGRKESEIAWREEALPGVLLGIACMVKLTPIVILPVLVAAGFWRLSLGMAAGILLTLVITGPVNNWQYFTIVLPTMTDFMDRQHFMSINRIAVEAWTLLEKWGLASSQHEGLVSLFGKAVCCGFYLAALWLAWSRRGSLTRKNAALIGCWLAPLLAASWFHHYTLAILPVLFVFRAYVVELAESDAGWLFIPPSEKPVRHSWKAPAARLGLLVLCLSPDYFFWLPGRLFHNWMSAHFEATDELLVSIANTVVFLFTLPYLLKPRINPRFSDWHTAPPVEISHVR